jgi:hypothetical protein
MKSVLDKSLQLSIAVSFVGVCLATCYNLYIANFSEVDTFKVYAPYIFRCAGLLIANLLWYGLIKFVCEEEADERKDKILSYFVVPIWPIASIAIAFLPLQ